MTILPIGHTAGVLAVMPHPKKRQRIKQKQWTRETKIKIKTHDI